MITQFFCKVWILCVLCKCIINAFFFKMQIPLVEVIWTASLACCLCPSSESRGSEKPEKFGWRKGDVFWIRLKSPEFLGCPFLGESWAPGRRLLDVSRRGYVWEAAKNNPWHIVLRRSSSCVYLFLPSPHICIRNPTNDPRKQVQSF